MAKVKVMSHRMHKVTLCAAMGDGVVRCMVSPGMNMLDKEAWDAVKEHEGVKKMLSEKMLEEKGMAEEKKAPAMKPVAKAPVVSDEDSSDEE